MFVFFWGGGGGGGAGEVVRLHVRRGKRERESAYRERVFIYRAATSGYNVRRVECPKHGSCLTSINDEQ